jgi:DNA-binding beta-propeller fold protein YncE
MKRLLLAMLAGFLLFSGTAAASPQVIRGHGETLHPEGIAWDPTRQAFLVGSYHHGTISVVKADGEARTLVNDPRIASSTGVHVDVARNRILATYTEGLGIFDLTTGRTLHLVKIGKSANDVAIDWFGNAYVTDIAGDTIYRVDVQGRASAFVKDPRLASPAFGMNGIVWHPAGFLLAVQYDSGKLYKITRGRIDEVRLEKPLKGGDGMALRPNGDLIVVTNKLGTDGEDAVTVLRSRGLWDSAKVTRHTAWPISAPTTVAVTPFGDYVLNGRLDWLFNENRTSDEFFISRI